MITWSLSTNLPTFADDRGKADGLMRSTGKPWEHLIGSTPLGVLVWKSENHPNLPGIISSLWLQPLQDLVKPWRWIRIHGLALPEGTHWALAQGLNGWTDSPLIQKNQFISPENNPKQRPFGDADLYEPNARPGTCHAWSWTIFGGPNAKNAFAGALYDHNCWSLFEIDLNHRSLTLALDIDGLRASTLPIGESGRCLGKWIFPTEQSLGESSAPLTEWFDAWTGLLKESRPGFTTPRQLADPIYGYTSWYYRYNRIDQEWLRANMHALPRNRWQIFQVDDGYQTKVGDWLRPSQGFPESIAPVLSEAKELGFQPGIWTAPFVALENSQCAYEHSDWFLRNDKGERILCGDFPHWGGKFFALDTENPAFLDHLTDVLATYFKKWGCQFLKADFLYASGKIASGHLTRAQRAYRSQRWLFQTCQRFGAQLLTCGPYMPSAYGLTDFCRIGPDVFTAWEIPDQLHFQSREKCSTRASIVNTLTRSCLDNRVWHNDPDVFILRQTPDVKLNSQEKLALAKANHLFGSLIFCSDYLHEYGPWEHEYLEILQKSAAPKRLGSQIESLSTNQNGSWHIRCRNSLHYEMIWTQGKPELLTSPNP